MKPKPSDALILAKLDEIHDLMIAQQAQTNERFDSVDKKLALILDRVSVQDLSPELEQAVKTVALRAHVIDEKVSDLS